MMHFSDAEVNIFFVWHLGADHRRISRFRTVTQIVKIKPDDRPVPLEPFEIIARAHSGAAKKSSYLPFTRFP
jgi:hypothetical protein